MDQPTLHAIASYDAETGVFTWKRRLGSDWQTNAWNGKWAGKVAGYPGTRGYIVVSYLKKAYRAHRLAWLYVHGGQLPSLQVDHVNGDTADNRIVNLRLATCAENQWNARRRVDNSSGRKGVSFDQASGLWTAQIRINGKRKWLGRHATPEIAHAAYVDAAKEHFQSFARSA